MAFVAVLILCSVPLCGGRLQRLGSVRIELTPLLFAALALQILITEVITGAPDTLLVALHLLSYALAAVVLWRNRRLPGLLVLGIGTLANAVTIALNDGTLPASRAALHAAGFPVAQHGFANSGAVAHPRLPWLGDTMATPSWLPLRNVLSIGDVLILLGAAIMVHAVCRTRPAAVCTAALRAGPPASLRLTRIVRMGDDARPLIMPI